MRDEYDDDDGGVPKAAENFWIISRPGPAKLATPRWIGRAHSWVHTTPQPWMLSGSEPWESCQTLDSYSTLVLAKNS